jgi:hypothetical protein
MSPRPRRAGLARALAPLPVAAVLACGALAGCANAAAAKAGPAAGGAICADTGHIVSLEISRTSAYPQNHETFTFPAKIEVTGTRQARAVAHALCELPKMPAGTIRCPADVGPAYRLTFSSSARRLAPVTLEATGCQQVSGLGSVRWTARSPGFWRILAVAAGITPASEATFRGTMPP